MSIPILETDRLILRPFSLDDVDATLAMESDERVVRYTHDGGLKSREQVESLIRKLIDEDYARFGFGRHAVVWKETSQFIGFAGLKYLMETHEVDLGYRIHPDFWGKGVATEACEACLKWGFEAYQLQKIVATVLPENAASIRVLEKLNFTFLEMVDEDGAQAKKYLLSR